MTFLDGPKTFDEALQDFIDDWLEDEPRSVLIAALAAKVEELIDDDAEAGNAAEG